MKIDISKFTEKQFELLESKQVVLDRNKDYSDDELIDIEQEIANIMPDCGVDKDGEPTKQFLNWENIHDVFLDLMGD